MNVRVLNQWYGITDLMFSRFSLALSQTLSVFGMGRYLSCLPYHPP